MLVEGEEGGEGGGIKGRWEGGEDGGEKRERVWWWLVVEVVRERGEGGAEANERTNAAAARPGWRCCSSTAR
jgi:hypothetical protein